MDSSEAKDVAPANLILNYAFSERRTQPSLSSRFHHAGKKQEYFLWYLSQQYKHHARRSKPTVPTWQPDDNNNQQTRIQQSLADSYTTPLPLCKHSKLNEASVNTQLINLSMGRICCGTGSQNCLFPRPNLHQRERNGSGPIKPVPAETLLYLNQHLPQQGIIGCST